MDILTRLIVIMDTEKNSNHIYYHIAKTILTHLDTLPKMGIEELANLCYTSPATISRFCRKSSMKSFADLKSTIAHANRYTENEVNFTDSEVREIDNNAQLIATKTFPLSIASLQETYDMLDMSMIAVVIKLLSKSARIAIFGSIFSQLVARDAQYKFLRLGKFVTAYTNPSDQEMDAHELSKHDVALFFSVSGSSSDLKKCCLVAQNNGAKAIVITNKKTSSLAKMADYIIIIGGTESDFTQSSTSGRIACMGIVDLLYTSLAYAKMKDQFSLPTRSTF
ncbi:hypothetical protein AwErysi_04560 [Erysipelotrichaceae bacterium]|nr:hypothetical protein AwErysi_04560 [Erysipelotrichaceae bacterium]